MTTVHPTALRTAVLPGRAPHQRLAALGLARDEHRIVTPDGGLDGWTRWVVARAMFTGEAIEFSPGGGRRTDATLSGTATLATRPGRLVGILDNDDETAPALWFAWSRTAVEVTPQGEQGVFRRRPRGFLLTGPDIDLGLVGVGQLIGRSTLRRGREGELLAALQTPPPVP